MTQEMGSDPQGTPESALSGAVAGAAVLDPTAAGENAVLGSEVSSNATGGGGDTVADATIAETPVAAAAAEVDGGNANNAGTGQVAGAVEPTEGNVAASDSNAVAADADAPAQGEGGNATEVGGGEGTGDVAAQASETPGEVAGAAAANADESGTVASGAALDTIDGGEGGGSDVGEGGGKTLGAEDGGGAHGVTGDAPAIPAAEAPVSSGDGSTQNADADAPAEKTEETPGDAT